MDKENINDVPLTDTPAKAEEEQINPGHEKTRKKLRIAGITCLAIGLPLSCVGIGIPLIFVGLVMTMYGFAGKLARYQAAEMAPVQKDTFNYIADGTQGGVKTVANAAGEGLATGFAAGGVNPDQTTAEPGVRCHKCNFIETPEAKFCSECGAAM
ncbi:MAG: hypothetical protein ACYSUG_05530, partial [Planctomycetota bacterium]